MEEYRVFYEYRNMQSSSSSQVSERKSWVHAMIHIRWNCTFDLVVITSFDVVWNLKMDVSASSPCKENSKVLFLPNSDYTMYVLDLAEWEWHWWNLKFKIHNVVFSQ